MVFFLSDVFLLHFVLHEKCFIKNVLFQIFIIRLISLKIFLLGVQLDFL